MVDVMLDGEKCEGRPPMHSRSSSRGGSTRPSTTSSMTSTATLASTATVDDAIFSTLDESKILEKEMCTVFSKYMETVQSAARMDLNEVVKEKVEKCRDLEEQLMKEREERTDLESTIETLKTEHAALESRRSLEVESIREAMDDMFKESMAEREERIKRVEKERDNAIAEVQSLSKKVDQMCLRERTAGEKARTTIEGMKAELAAMHDAMASLHGEMGAMQRELDTNEEREKALSQAAEKAKESLKSVSANRDKLKSEKKQVEVELTSLNKAARAAVLELANQRQNSEVEVSSSKKEVETAKAETSRAQAETKKALEANQDLNRMLTAIDEEAKGLRLGAEKKDKELEDMAAQLKEFKSASERQALKEEETRRRISKLEAERARLVEEIDAMRPELESYKSDTKSLLKEIQRLGMEKRDLILDGQQRMEKSLAIQQELDFLRAKLDKVIETQKDLERERDSAIKNEKEAKQKVEEVLNQLQKLEHAASIAEKDKEEALQAKKEVSESAKTTQRDAAARIVDFSQKNSKLLVELTAARASLGDVEQERDNLKDEVEGLREEMEGHKSEVRTLWEKLQGLEDELEETRMKKEAVDSQLLSLKESEQLDRIDRESQVRKTEESHKRELEEMRRALTENTEQRLAQAEALWVETEKMCERNIIKTREGMKRQVDEMNAARLREMTEARNKALALGNAVDNLTKELREEESKNKSLRDELSQLQRLVGAHQYNGEVKPYGELVRENDVIRKEMAQLKNSHEMEVSDLQRHVCVVTQSKQGVERTLDDTKERVQALERELYDLQHRLSKSERDASTLRMSFDQSESQVSNLQRTLHDTEGRMQDALRNKDQELERLTRRNRMLQETVSRLSSEGSSDAGVILPHHHRSSANMSSQDYGQIDTYRSGGGSMSEHAAVASSSFSFMSPCRSEDTRPSDPSNDSSNNNSNDQLSRSQLNNSFSQNRTASSTSITTMARAGAEKEQESRHHHPINTVLYGCDAWHAAGVSPGSGFQEPPPMIRPPPRGRTNSPFAAGLQQHTQQQQQQSITMTGLIDEQNGGRSRNQHHEELQHNIGGGLGTDESLPFISSARSSRENHAFVEEEGDEDETNPAVHSYSSVTSSPIRTGRGRRGGFFGPSSIDDGDGDIGYPSRLDLMISNQQLELTSAATKKALGIGNAKASSIKSSTKRKAGSSRSKSLLVKGSGPIPGKSNPYGYPPSTQSKTSSLTSKKIRTKDSVSLGRLTMFS